ncbi:MAG: WD40 repeat domain-containing protein [Myxococcota bacterium]|nr:WD40 repeat domain-containing protein [Myxococcota bacterium]
MSRSFLMRASALLASFTLLATSIGCSRTPETKPPERLIPLGLGGAMKQAGLPFGVIARLGGGERLDAPISSLVLTSDGENKGKIFAASDAGLLAFGASDGIRQRPLREVPEDRRSARPADPFQMMLSSSERHLITASLSWEQSIEIWDVETRRKLLSLPRPAAFRPIVRAAPNADEVLVAYEDRLERRAIDNPDEVQPISLTDDDSGWRARVNDVAYTPGGQQVVLVGSGGIEVRSVLDGAVLERVPHKEGFQHLALERGGEWLALARPASRIELRRLGALSEVAFELELGQSLERVERMAFARGGSILLASVVGAGGEETLRIYALDREKRRGRELGRIASTSFDVREDGFLSVAAGHMLRRFQIDASAPRGVRSLELGVGHVMPPEQLHLMDGTRAILSSSRDGEVIRWDLEKLGGEVVRSGQIANTTAAAPSEDGRAFFIAARDHAAKRWQLEKHPRDARDAPVWEQALKAPVARLAIEAGGGRLIGAGPGGVLWRWSLQTGEALERWPLGGERSRFAGASEQLEWMAVLEPGARELRIWRTQDGFLYQAYSWPDKIAICDGRASAKAMVCADSDFLRWLPLKPRRAPRTQPHGFARVDGLSFSPRADQIAIWGIRPGRREDRMELWIIPLESGEKTRIFTQVPSQITAASFFPGGRYMATGHVDGLIRIWDLEARAKPSER